MIGLLSRMLGIETRGHMALGSFEAQQEVDMFCCLLGLTCQGACCRMTGGLGQFCTAGHLI